MVFRHRSVPGKRNFEITDRLWEVPGETPRASDFYVVVDERVDGRLTLAFDSWPRLDKTGHLVFEGDTKSVPVHEDVFHAVVSKARRRQGLKPALVTREIRIGDAFLIRGKAVRDPAQWTLILDVTPGARKAVKAAFYGAITPVIPRMEKIPKPIDEDELPPPGPVVRPVV